MLQVFQFLGVGQVVYAVREDLCLLVLRHAAYLFGHCPVGQQHEFLDEFVGFLGLFEIYPRGFALFVNVEAYLYAVKVDGSGGKSLLGELFGQMVQGEDGFGQQVFPLGLGGPVSAFLYYLLCLLVGEPALAAYDGAHYAVLLHLGPVIEVEDDGVGQLVLVGTQRAEVVAQAFGQHGYGAVHQIDRGGTAVSLLVNDVSFGHVVGHVGNVYTHLPESLLQGSDAQCVVKVFGVGRVDGEGCHSAHVQARLQLLLGYVARNQVCSPLHCLGILVGQPVLGQDGMHLGIVLARAAQDVNDCPHGIVGLCRPFHYLHHGLVAVLSVLQFAAGDEYVVSQRAPFGDEEGIVAFHTQSSHKGVSGALYDFYHLTLFALSAPFGKESHLHTVSVKGMCRIPFGNAHRLAAIVGHEGVASVALALEGPLQCLSLVA